MMKRHSRIGKELIGVVLAIFILFALILIIVSSYEHAGQVDGLYKEEVSRLADAVSRLLDGDFIKKLSDTVDEEEFQALRKEASGSGDGSALEDYLKERGLYDEYEKATDILEQQQEALKVQYIYVQDVGPDDAMYLLDPSETILNLGHREVNASGLESVVSNEKIPATVSKSEYGWLCTGGEPVVDSNGDNVAVMCVDISMDEIMQKRQSFVFVMASFSIVVLLVLGGVCVVFIRRRISEPIYLLASKAGEFGNVDEDDLKDHVIDLPMIRKDEIGDLYQDIRSMQFGIIRYVENLESVTQEKERIGTELNIARRIQAGMLPNTFPAFPDRNEFNIFAFMKPAKEVAGDFYDFFLIDSDHLGLVMADVSGKGVPAALFMMMSKILISNFAQMGELPHRVLELTNERLCINNEESMFVTVWMGILTISTGRVIASNAGHEFPVLQNEEGEYELFKDRHGLVVGGMEGLKYRDYEFVMKPGMTLYLYTDGVPEATTADNEMFGTERMLEALNRKKDAEPEELLTYMLHTVDDFDGDVPQFDDITMLAIKYLGPNPGKEV